MTERERNILSGAAIVPVTADEICLANVAKKTSALLVTATENENKQTVFDKTFGEFYNALVFGGGVLIKDMTSDVVKYSTDDLSIHVLGDGTYEISYGKESATGSASDYPVFTA